MFTLIQDGDDLHGPLTREQLESLLDSMAQCLRDDADRIQALRNTLGHRFERVSMDGHYIAIKVEKENPAPPTKRYRLTGSFCTELGGTVYPANSVFSTPQQAIDVAGAMLGWELTQEDHDDHVASLMTGGYLQFDGWRGRLEITAEDA